MKNEREADREAAKKGWIKLLLIFLFTAVLALCKMYLIDFADVSGQSMYPTFHSGDTCLELKSNYTIDRFDVIVVKTESKRLIKRVIGMPNDTVQIIDGKVLINGKPLQDDLDIRIEKAGCAADPVTLAEDEYFVIGDNRNDSLDSRDYGAFQKSEVCGKIFIRLFPLNKITTDFSIKKE